MKSEHHDTLAPSSVPAILQCACFAARGDGVDDDDMDLGTEMHEYQAKCLDPDRSEPIFRLMSDADFEDCDYVREEMIRMLRDNCPDAEIEVERRVTLYDDEENEILYGTRDVGAHNDNVVVVGDWKGGLGYTLRDCRGQLASYALADMRTYGCRKALCIEGYIRPRKLNVYWVTYDEAAAIVECAAQRRRNPNRLPTPCEYCKWCGALLSCSAVTRQMNLVCKTMDDYDGEIDIRTPWQITDPEKMSAALTFAREVLDPYAKSVTEISDRIEAAALAMSEGDNVPYYVRVMRNGAKKVEDVEAAYRLLGLSQELFFRALKLSLPQLAKAYREQHAMTSDKKARDEVERLLGDNIHVEPGKWTLVKSKKREGFSD